MYLTHIESSIGFGDITDFENPIASVSLRQADPVIACDNFVVNRQDGVSIHSHPCHLHVHVIYNMVHQTDDNIKEKHNVVYMCCIRVITKGDKASHVNKPTYTHTPFLSPPLHATSSLPFPGFYHPHVGSINPQRDGSGKTELIPKM